MSRVKRLPPEVRNLIAAGEVVESPLSVVKELVENSLDAGASKVKVKILNGGLDLIEVVDDGVGIPSEDLPLVVERYTTSKIDSKDDLLNISTYGFRGEALYAISQVSTLTIESKSRGEEIGSYVKVQNGRLISKGISQISRGTIVRVEKLFANYPARRKSIKPRVEESKIKDFLRKLALGVSAGITLEIGNRKIFSSYPNEPITSKLRNLWNWSPEKLATLKREEHNLELEAYLSIPPDLHKDSNKLVIFINGRLVSPPEVLEGVKIGYLKAFQREGLYPHGVLFLKLPPDEVDVNVHPRKLEVRFYKPIMVRTFITKTLEEELRKFSVSVSQSYTRKSTSISSPLKGRTSKPLSSPKSLDKIVSDQRKQASFKKSSDTKPPGVISQRELVPQPLPQIASPGLRWGIQGDELLVILREPFIALLREGEVILIDQHAAHEKLIYLELKEMIDKLGSLPSQRLFLPLEVELPSDLLEIAIEEKENLKRFGFEYSYSEGKLVIKSLPKGLGNLSGEEEWAKLLKAGPEERLYHIASNIACKSAIKGNDSLTIEEAFNLWFKLKERLEDVALCPHGRPAVIRMDYDILLKMFERA